MKEYDKEENRELLNLINKIQKIEFNYKKENGRTPSNEEIASILNISINKISEVKDFITFLNKEDEEFKLKSKWHTKEDIIEAKTIRNKKKL